jgi:peptide/nickel transport system substrate-binding protein
VLLFCLLILLTKVPEASLASSALTDSAASDYASSDAPSQGGALIFGLIGEVKSLDPGVLQDKAPAQITTNIYENLVKFDRKSLEIRPCLATRWETGNNDRTWTFSLRKNVKFHDGTIFDAWAVKFTFDRQLDPRHPFHYPSYGRFLFCNALFGSGHGLIDNIEVIDPYTVRFTLSQPCVPFLKEIALYPFAIVSPRAVKKWKDEYFEHPVGTGPFRFLEWRKPQRIVLAVNRDYWGNRPHLDRVIFEPFADITSCQRQLERGQIDLMNSAQFSTIDDLKQNAEIKIAKLPSLHFCYMAINCQRPFFNSRDFRKALNSLIDRKSIAEVLNGRALPATGVLPPGMMGHSSDIGYSYEPKKGSAYLKRFYPTKEGSQPVLLFPDVSQPYLNDPEGMATRICEFLREGGLDVTPMKVTGGEFGRKVRFGEYDLALWGIINETGDPDVFMVPPWDPLNARPGGTNVSFYMRNELHRELWSARGITDERKRESLYRRVDRSLFEDAAMVPLAYCYEILAYRKSVHDVPVHFSGLYDMTSVWMEK